MGGGGQGLWGGGGARGGAVGVAGAAGAVAAPVAGRRAGGHGPAMVARRARARATVSVAALFLRRLLPVPARLALIVISALGFDFGVQATLVSHQTLIFGLEPAARSRLNALMFTGVFIGMAAGSALGSLMLERAGWPGVVALLTVAGAGSFVVRMWGRGAETQGVITTAK